MKGFAEIVSAAEVETCAAFIVGRCDNGFRRWWGLPFHGILASDIALMQRQFSNTSGRILCRPGKESPEFHQFFLDESFDEIRGKK